MSVSRWAKEGRIPKNSSGQIPVIAASAALDEEREAYEDDIPTDPSTYDEARTRKMLADAARSELELAKAKGEVVDAAEAQDDKDREVTIARTLLMQIGAKVSSQVAGMTDAREIRLLIEAETRTIFADLMKALEVDG
jgi:hypothetical protein